MNISIGYLWETFWVAVDALVGNGPWENGSEEYGAKRNTVLIGGVRSSSSSSHRTSVAITAPPFSIAFCSSATPVCSCSCVRRWLKSWKFIELLVVS